MESAHFVPKNMGKGNLTYLEALFAEKETSPNIGWSIVISKDKISLQGPESAILEIVMS